MNIRRLIAHILKLPKPYLAGGALAAVLVVALGVHALGAGSPSSSPAASLAHVQVTLVGSLASHTGPLPVTGKVTSLSQASILAQTSGEVVALSRSLGDSVAAGTIIGRFENSSQQAAVLQAQGSYDAASAALAKASGTSAANSGITATQASQNQENARIAAAAALQSAYAALDDAIHTKADQLFTNPRTDSPRLVLLVPDSRLVNTLQIERVQLEATLTKASSLANAPSRDSDADLVAMAANVQATQAFLNNLITAVNETQPSSATSATTISGYQSSLSAARSEVVSAYSAITSAKNSYDTAALSATAAANSASGGSSSDIAAAQANVKQALGALNAAQASLEKTYIRSPISGVIVSLPITKGDYVSSFTQVAQVSNPGALYIETHVTSDDARTLAVGNKALIDGTTAGVITFIAPALDPTTNQIEVKVGIIGATRALTGGDTVTLSLERSGASPAQAAKDPKAPIRIPIVATKITPQGPIVFSVDPAASMLTAHSITLGSILGDQVTVESGLTLEMSIVTDARGLAAGQTVVVDH